MFEGSYPPGVTGEMIDHYFGLDNKRRCDNCRHYDGECCTYRERFDSKDSDDYCDHYDYFKEWESIEE